MLTWRHLYIRQMSKVDSRTAQIANLAEPSHLSGHPFLGVLVPWDGCPRSVDLTPLLRRICSRTFSVRLRLFSALLLCSFLLFCPSPSLLIASVSVLCFRLFRLILSAFHIRIRPVSVSSDLAFILFLLPFGYNPYQPNPITPRFLIVSVLIVL